MPIITDTHIQAAMKFYELKAGPRDGITICREVSSLANVLGAMWYDHEKTASVEEGGPIHTLLLEACVPITDDTNETSDEEQLEELPRG